MANNRSPALRSRSADAPLFPPPRRAGLQPVRSPSVPKLRKPDEISSRVALRCQCILHTCPAVFRIWVSRVCTAPILSELRRCPVGSVNTLNLRNSLGHRNNASHVPNMEDLMHRLANTVSQPSNPVPIQPVDERVLSVSCPPLEFPVGVDYALFNLYSPTVSAPSYAR